MSNEDLMSSEVLRSSNKKSLKAELDKKKEKNPEDSLVSAIHKIEYVCLYKLIL